MSRRKKLLQSNDTATKGDVESIVTRVVNQAIDHFAIIVGRSFADTQAQIHEIGESLTATKGEFAEFRHEMLEFKENTERSLYVLQTDVTDLKQRMGNVENRLDRVETLGEMMIGMWRDHEERIIDLETSK